MKCMWMKTSSVSFYIYMYYVFIWQAALSNSSTRTRANAVPSHIFLSQIQSVQESESYLFQNLDPFPKGLKGYNEYICSYTAYMHIKIASTFLNMLFCLCEMFSRCRCCKVSAPSNLRHIGARVLRVCYLRSTLTAHHWNAEKIYWWHPADTP